MVDKNGYGYKEGFECGKEGVPMKEGYCEACKQVAEYHMDPEDIPSCREFCDVYAGYKAGEAANTETPTGECGKCGSNLDYWWKCPQCAKEGGRHE